MEITEVRVNLNRSGKVKAFVQVVIDGVLLVGDIRVLEGREGTLYVAMPSRRLRNGSFRDVVHALNTETRRQLEEAILNEYARAVAEQGEPGNGQVGTRTHQIVARLLGEQYWTGETGEEE